jgi:hypothetical protein
MPAERVSNSRLKRAGIVDKEHWRPAPPRFIWQRCRPDPGALLRFAEGVA